MNKVICILICGIFIGACAGCSNNSSVTKGTGGAGASDAYTEVIVQLETEKPLEAVLTLPKTSGKPPVVILIHGSGPSDKDETIGENKPFADIAHGLAQRGIASFRFDKRTYTYPDDAADYATVRGEVLNDAAAAVKQMKNNKSVGNVYVLGHSMGGMLAPTIAAESDGDVAGIILLAGTPRSLVDLMYDQNMELIEAMKLLPEQTQEMIGDVNAQLDPLRELDESDTGDYLGAPASYWASLNAIDPAAVAEGLDIPMLIMQGTDDFQVSVENDFNAWKELLEGSEGVRFKLYDGLNHLFMPTSGKRDVTEYDAASVVDPQVIEDIATFIKENEQGTQQNT
jgi:alpha-beta hydrolase superfamily lysophospholipase